MSYFGISGLRNPYSSVYAQSRIRTSPARRQNNAPYTTRARYNNRIGTYSNSYNYGGYGVFDSLNRLQEIKNNAVKLSDSTSRLLGTGKNDLFVKTQASPDDQASQSVYNTDEIYAAVKDFVEDYNDTITSANSDNTRSVQSAFATLSRTTSAVQKNLREIGITVEKDGKLTLDEKTLRNADMAKVKDLMGGSYARSAASAAARIYNSANSAAITQTASARRGITGYGLPGIYNGYNFGSYFNRFF